MLDQPRLVWPKAMRDWLICLGPIAAALDFTIYPGHLWLLAEWLDGIIDRTQSALIEMLVY